MRDFKKRRTLANEVLWAAIGCAGILAIAFVAFVAMRAAWGMYGKFAAAAAARSSAESELRDLEVRLAQVQQDVDALSSERGVEAAMRERYGVARPGEGEITIVRPASTTEVAGSSKGFWSGLWNLLFVW